MSDSWPPHVFLDIDGKHVVFSHKCNGLIRTTQLPYPVWAMDAEGVVTPSIHCKACGFHDNLENPGEPERQRRDETARRASENKGG